MKRNIIFITFIALTFISCVTHAVSLGNKKNQTVGVSMTDNKNIKKQIKMKINEKEVNIVLNNSYAAEKLYEQLPLELEFSDYNQTEKIAYLPEKLSVKGEPDGYKPSIGDLCLYAPWGNLCIFYKDFRYSDSLISLCKVEEGMDILTAFKDNFKVVLEKIN